MPDKIKPYKNSNVNKKEQIAKMFNHISGKYDLLNRIISFGIDIKWRKKVVSIVAKCNPINILDIATGTGDLAINLSKTNAKKITGIDISKGMLDIGINKVKKLNLSDKIELILCDTEDIIFGNNTFDVVTVAFGIRNFDDLYKGLKEILRVLKSGGTFVILETSLPTKTPYKQIYSLYLNKILPFIGSIFSEDGNAYSYLSKSANVFPYGIKLNRVLEKVGFINVRNYPQFFGVASIYVANKK